MERKLTAAIHLRLLTDPNLELLNLPTQMFVSQAIILRNANFTKLRYAAYATRLRTILLSAQRYVAYTSDIGESFRPGPLSLRAR